MTALREPEVLACLFAHQNDHALHAPLSGLF
jgi:hypothetical protein